jgi:antitoxin (DNA-binding transcriptional repressor) of toxin-antitoxin stability system
MAEPAGREISQRDPRNGTPVARLIPLRRRTFVPRSDVLASFATAPTVDPDRFRSDLEAHIDQEPYSEPTWSGHLTWMGPSSE